MAASYDISVYIVYDHHVISFSNRPGQEIVRKPNCCVIIITFTQKSHDPLAISLQVPYDYLKSIQSFYGPEMAI